MKNQISNDISIIYKNGKRWRVYQIFVEWENF